MVMKLPKEFYLQEDVLKICKELLGKFLYTKIDGKLSGGMITETEAYKAPEDKASHAYGGRKTPRTEIFYEEGGVSYVYLCYGIHHLFNVVTNKKDIPHAILIRAIEPFEGVEYMLKRRNKNKVSTLLTCGPGSMSQALGIGIQHNKVDLQGNDIWIEDRGIKIAKKDILKGPRIGVDYAAEYASKAWRFGIKNNSWVSKPF
jgi:DNA-3-methyladenine glycosylase